MRRTYFLILLFSLAVLPCLSQEKELPKRILAPGILIGKAINLVIPPFPDCNSKFSKVNKVTVQFVVNKIGNIESAQAIAGQPLLQAASTTAILKSRFNQSIINAESVKAFGTIIMSLDGKIISEKFAS